MSKKLLVIDVAALGWSSSLPFPTPPETVLDLARFTRNWMAQQAGK